jgi:hypothetical protein
MTYERDQQVVGWHRHQLGGTGLARGIAAIPGVDGDELWFIVERTVNFTTERHVEVGLPGLEDDAPLEDAFFLDDALQYEGLPVTTITGLWHLNNRAVSVLADGVPYHNKAVAGGVLTLDIPASKVTVGYNYTSRIKTLHVEAGAQGGTAQGQIGRVYEVIARLQNSIGGSYGTDLMQAAGKLDPIAYRDANAPLDTAVPLFNGDKRLPFDGEWDRDRYIVIEHSDPLPFTLTALIIGQRVSG